MVTGFSMVYNLSLTFRPLFISDATPTLRRWYRVAMQAAMRGQVTSQAWDRLGVRLALTP